jgi:uncharacterized protein YqfB (UPF0267 family)
MAVLSFRSHWITPILTGRKTQTLRHRIPGTLWVDDEFDAGRNWLDPAFARLQVVAIDHVHVDDLTHVDARRGATSLAALIDEIEETYPDASTLVGVRFRLT